MIQKMINQSLPVIKTEINTSILMSEFSENCCFCAFAENVANNNAKCYQIAKI